VSSSSLPLFLFLDDSADAFFVLATRFVLPGMMRLFAFSQAILMSVCVLLFWLIVAHISFPLARPCSTGYTQTHVAAPFFLPARARFFIFFF
jgi:hypothetical protein